MAQMQALQSSHQLKVVTEWKVLVHHLQLQGEPFLFQSCKVWPNYTQLMVPTFMFVESNRFDKKIVFLINSDSCPNTKDFYMLKKSHQCILSWANSLTLPQHFCGKWLFWLHFSQTVRYAHRKKVILIKVISNWNSIRYLKFIHMNNWKHAHTMVSLP